MVSGIPIKAGQRIRVHQQIDRREGNWETTVEGTVLEVLSKKTGSWHAHGKDDKLWLNRIKLQKADGEISYLVIDQYTRVEVLSDADAAAQH